MSNNNKKYRLPFALCKKYGITIHDDWTPKDAWEALEKCGCAEAKQEYENYFNGLEKEKSRANQQLRLQKEKQEKDPKHNPIKDYEHQEGKIAGIPKGNPMSHEKADSGKVNPYFNDNKLIGYKDNCQTCVAVYYARLLGYDVRALPDFNNEYIRKLSEMTNLAYLDENGNHPKYIKKPKNISAEEWLDNVIKEGEIYSFEFDQPAEQYGHVIVAKKQNDKIIFYDPQKDKEINILTEYGFIDNEEAFKLTGCSMDEEFCDKIMR